MRSVFLTDASVHTSLKEGQKGSCLHCTAPGSENSQNLPGSQTKHQQLQQREDAGLARIFKYDMSFEQTSVGVLYLLACLLNK